MEEDEDEDRMVLDSIICFVEDKCVGYGDNLGLPSLQFPIIV